MTDKSTPSPAAPPPREQMFVLLAEIRQCINDDKLMQAQRKVFAIEAILKSQAALAAPPEGQIEAQIAMEIVAAVSEALGTGLIFASDVSAKDRMVAAIRDLQRIAAPLEGWQDIATCPKDGNSFLAGATACVFMAHWANGVVDSTSYDETTGGYEGRHATHWMPLPAPPLAASGSGETK